jgi:hypothetical protein
MSFSLLSDLGRDSADARLFIRTVSSSDHGEACRHDRPLHRECMHCICSSEAVFLSRRTRDGIGSISGVVSETLSGRLVGLAPSRTHGLPGRVPFRAWTSQAPSRSSTKHFAHDEPDYYPIEPLLSIYDRPKCLLSAICDTRDCNVRPKLGVELHNVRYSYRQPPKRILIRRTHAWLSFPG